MLDRIRVWRNADKLLQFRLVSRQQPEYQAADPPGEFIVQLEILISQGPRNNHRCFHWSSHRLSMHRAYLQRLRLLVITNHDTARRMLIHFSHVLSNSLRIVALHAHENGNIPAGAFLTSASVVLM